MFHSGLTVDATSAMSGVSRDLDKSPGPGEESLTAQGRGASIVDAKWPADVGTLADLLHETAGHHASFESVAPPHDWWDWYAAYLDARQRGSTPEVASAAAGRYLAEVKHVVV
jgi:hypothetical protein